MQVKCPLSSSEDAGHTDYCHAAPRTI